jgi:hypothetical protein
MRKFGLIALTLGLVLVAGLTLMTHAGTINRVQAPFIIGGSVTFDETPLSIRLGATNLEDGLSLDSGGDVDTAVVSVGSPPQEARRTGNGVALPSADANTAPDNYMQFRVDDARLYGGEPTTHVALKIDYYDQGTDRFRVQYDALPTATSSGLFADGGVIIKTGTNTFRTAILPLCDVNFANRTNGGDFRIFDDDDGAEIIRRVEVVLLPPTNPPVNVDSFGANPFDNRPDSAAIQAALDQACSGSTILFTSGAGDPNYRGYLIDKTLFLTGASAKQNMTYTSSLPFDHALLQATADLKGPVIHLFARSLGINAGTIDDITLRAIDIDGGRDVRQCHGADGVANGSDDNWGSWLPECSQSGDNWCLAGNIFLYAGIDDADPAQDYRAHPDLWSTGIVVEDVVSRQIECATGLGLYGAAAVVRDVTIDIAGDHVHAPGCALTDDDGDQGGWSDGITFTGPEHQVIGNTVINPSDIGIIFFGGRDTTIADNTVRVTPGNYGAFGGIAVHSWVFGNTGGLRVTGNEVTSEGDSACGGLHTGINLGPHMWSGGCVGFANSAAVGNRGSCIPEPPPPNGALCIGGACQVWTHVPPGAALVLRDNKVTGAHINYLIEGIEGPITTQDNVSSTPRLSDWESADGCDGVTWGPLHRVAHHPTQAGWMDVRVHCER